MIYIYHLYVLFTYHWKRTGASLFAAHQQPHSSVQPPWKTLIETVSKFLRFNLRLVGARYNARGGCSESITLEWRFQLSLVPTCCWWLSQPMLRVSLSVQNPRRSVCAGMILRPHPTPPQGEWERKPAVFSHLFWWESLNEMLGRADGVSVIGNSRLGYYREILPVSVMGQWREEISWWWWGGWGGLGMHQAFLSPPGSSLANAVSVS